MLGLYTRRLGDVNGNYGCCLLEQTCPLTQFFCIFFNLCFATVGYRLSTVGYRLSRREARRVGAF